MLRLCIFSLEKMENIETNKIDYCEVYWRRIHAAELHEDICKR